MNEVLRLTISPNETNTPERIKDLMKAIESFKGQIIYAGKDSQQPADLCLLSQTKRIHIEIKDVQKSNDLWGSKQGHIGDQLVAFLDENAEAMIGVMCSLDQARNDAPYLTNIGGRCQRASDDLRDSNKTTLRALAADSYGCCIPILYLSKNRVLSFQEILSYGKNRLLGANPFQWSSPYRGKAGKIKALMGARGIGVKNAEALLEHFGSIRNISLADYDALKACPNIGPERAISIMEMMK
jgi:hypothetical protein